MVIFLLPIWQEHECLVAAGEKKNLILFVRYKLCVFVPLLLLFLVLISLLILIKRALCQPNGIEMKPIVLKFGRKVKRKFRHLSMRCDVCVCVRLLIVDTTDHVVLLVWQSFYLDFFLFSFSLSNLLRIWQERTKL